MWGFQTPPFAQFPVEFGYSLLFSFLLDRSICRSDFPGYCWRWAATVPLGDWARCGWCPGSSAFGSGKWDCLVLELLEALWAVHVWSGNHEGGWSCEGRRLVPSIAHPEKAFLLHRAVLCWWLHMAWPNQKPLELYFGGRWGISSQEVRRGRTMRLERYMNNKGNGILSPSVKGPTVIQVVDGPTIEQFPFCS